MCLLHPENSSGPNRRDALKTLGGLGVAGFFGALGPGGAVQAASAPRPTAAAAASYAFNRAPLPANTFAELPLGAVRPRGWLLEQLRRQASGLTGRLGELYPNVGPTNAWLGGRGDAWERGPYWLDGLVPLAHLLQDEQLVGTARPWIEHALASQQPSGYFGPPDTREGLEEPMPGFQTGDRADWWPRMVMLKVLQQHHDATGDARVLEMMTAYFRYQHQQLPRKPLDHWTWWARERGGDNQASVYWLYNRTGDAFLLDLARTLFQQTADWTDRFTREHGIYHGVNTAMGIKQPAMGFLLTGETRYLDAIDAGYAWLRRDHGQVQGMFSGDEALHGTNPVQGTELCTVVEYMHSLEALLGVAGRVGDADRLERIAFNALPTQTRPDYMARQYFQQPNQVRVSREPHTARNFYDNSEGERILYGFTSGYPCCTANMHQGWPKFTRSLWHATADGGLAALLYAPCHVEARVAGGTAVRFDEETAYPFEDTVRFAFRGETPVQFPLHLRIPGWIAQATITVNGAPWGTPEGGQIARVDRLWQHGDRVELVLPPTIHLSYWHEGAAGVERGPLVYALPIKGQWQQVGEEFGVPVWGMAPEEDWNYGLVVGNRGETRFSVETGSVPAYPWTPDAAPVRLKTRGRKIPFWKEYNESAGPLPLSPARTREPEEDITLIPYGATVLRVGELPTVRPA